MGDVRRIMMQGVALWRDVLQFEDQQIEPVLEHLRHCIQRFEEQHGDVHSACAGKQWAKLKIALRFAAADSPFMERKKQGSRPTTKGGVYNPIQLVRCLRRVKQVKDRAMKLVCMACQHSITSDWYIERSDSNIRVLIPHGGHKVGRRRCGRYKPEVAATPTRLDTNLSGELTKFDY